MKTAFLTLCAAALLAACATPPAPPPPSAEGWQPLALPGKKATLYRWTEKDGRRALEASSERSASIWRKRLEPSLEQVGEVRFSWWAQGLIPGANVSDVDHEDAVARVIFGFGGDVAKLPLKTRMKFELAQALTGEAPPYATLMYVWDAHAPLDTVVVSGRSSRVRKIVVESGAAQLDRWRLYERDIAADFVKAYGEAPGALIGVALMTDADNTAGRAQASYGPVCFPGANLAARTP